MIFRDGIFLTTEGEVKLEILKKFFDKLAECDLYSRWRGQWIEDDEIFDELIQEEKENFENC